MNAKRDKNRIRRQFVKNNIDIEKSDILEIGAFDSPTFSKEEASIYYCDYFSKEELGQNHNEAKPQRVAQAVDIDYVIKGNRFKESIDKKFDLVIANHVVEHTPNIIDWLQNISSVLKEGGKLFLTVPHKEYTFDKMRQTTPLREVIRNYDDGLLVPNRYQIFDHLYFYRPFRAHMVWENEYDRIFHKRRFKTATDAWAEVDRRLSITDYVDVHCSVFTYQSFVEMIRDLHGASYIDLRTTDTQDVVKPYNEFYVMLSLPK